MLAQGKLQGCMAVVLCGTYYNIVRAILWPYGDMWHYVAPFGCAVVWYTSCHSMQIQGENLASGLSLLYPIKII